MTGLAQVTVIFVGRIGFSQNFRAGLGFKLEVDGELVTECLCMHARTHA